MSRRIRLAALALVCALGLSAAACASPTEPAGFAACEDGTNQSACQFNDTGGNGSW